MEINLEQLVSSKLRKCVSLNEGVFSFFILFYFICLFVFKSVSCLIFTMPKLKLYIAFKPQHSTKKLLRFCSNVVQTDICIYVYMYTHTPIHNAYIYTHIYAHTHIYTHFFEGKKTIQVKQHYRRGRRIMCLGTTRLERPSNI